MNRTGLVVALAVAVAVGFCSRFIRGSISLISALFYDPATKRFRQRQLWAMSRARDAAELLIVVLVARRFFSLARQAHLAAPPHADRGRAAVFLVLTLALGPGVLANVILKDHWGRIAPDRRDRVRRQRPLHAVVGSAQRLRRQLLVHRRRAVGRVLDAWRRRRWRRRNGGRSPMAPRSPSAPGSACCAWPPARISSPTSSLPACSCSSWSGRCTA